MTPKEYLISYSTLIFLAINKDHHHQHLETFPFLLYIELGPFGLNTVKKHIKTESTKSWRRKLWHYLLNIHTRAYVSYEFGFPSSDVHNLAYIGAKKFKFLTSLCLFLFQIFGANIVGYKLHEVHLHLGKWISMKPLGKNIVFLLKKALLMRFSSI